MEEEEGEEEEVGAECIERWWRRGAAEFVSLSGVGPPAPSRGQHGRQPPASSREILRQTVTNTFENSLNSINHLLLFDG